MLDDDWAANLVKPKQTSTLLITNSKSSMSEIQPVFYKIIGRPALYLFGEDKKYHHLDMNFDNFKILYPSYIVKEIDEVEPKGFKILTGD